MLTAYDLYPSYSLSLSNALLICKNKTGQTLSRHAIQYT